MKRIWFLFLITLIVYSCEETEPLGNLKGLVKDSKSGSSLDGVKVELEGHDNSKRTNGQGEYEFKEIQPNVYSVKFTKDDYEPHTETAVKVNDGVTSSLNISLVPFGPKIEVAPLQLDYGKEESQLTIEINNAGKADLTFELESNKDWLSPAIKSGTVNPNKKEFVKINVSREGKLAYGSHSAKLTVNNNADGPVDVEVLMEYEKPNMPPTASFKCKPEKGDLNTVFVFDASATFDDYDAKDKLMFAWEFEQDAGFSEWSTENRVTYQYSTEGAKVVTLKVRDTKEAEAVKTMAVNVASNRPPQVMFTLTPLQGSLKTEFQFDASGTTDDLDDVGAMKFSWQFEEGEDYSTPNDQLIVSHIYTTSGTKTVTLRVEDSHGLKQSLSKTLTVAENQAPQVAFDISPSTNGKLTTEFQFDASATKDDNDKIGYLKFSWQFEEGEAFTASNSQYTASKTYSTSGTKKVTLKVTDTHGKENVLSKTITVAENSPPLPQFSLPSVIRVNKELQLDAGSSTDDNDAVDNLQVSWDFGNGFSPYNYTKAVRCTFTSLGIKSITLKVKDNHGLENTLTKQIEVVANQPPNAIFSVDPFTGNTHTTFTLDATGCTDPDDATSELQYRWDKGDGNGYTNWSNETSTTVRYTTSGSKNIILEVKDLEGGIGKSTQTLDVEEAPKIYFVAPYGSDLNDGLTWATSFKTIHKALNIATEGYEIWVAAGQYNNGATIKEGVNVYGGFQGDETERDQRDWGTFQTVINGQINQPNEFTVETTWDGFVQQNSENRGVIIDKGGVVLNFTIKYNGSGVYIKNGGLLHACIVEKNNNNGTNTGDNRYGVGIYIANNGKVQNCLIKSNQNYRDNGGGIYMEGGLVINSTIEANKTYSIVNNEGGGIYCKSGKIVGCLISGNTSHYPHDRWGSGDGPNGGGISVAGNVEIINSTVMGNHLSDGYNNSTMTGGAGIYINSSGCSIINTVIWQNTSDINDIVDNIKSTGSAYVAYSAIEGGYEGTQNMNLSITNPPLLDSNYKPQVGSSLIDAGNSNYLLPYNITKDLGGNNRVKGGQVDIGAYEY